MTAPSPVENAGKLLSFKIKVDGTDLDSSYQVMAIDVWFEVNKIPRARIVLSDGLLDLGKEAFAVSSGKTLLPGAEIRICAGYSEGDHETEIFRGLIVRHGLEVSQHQVSKLILDLADPTLAMTLSRHSAVYSQIKDSDLLSTLIRSNGLVADVQSTAGQHERIVQFNCTDWDFLLLRAEANGLLVITEAGKVTVKAPDTKAAPVLRVEYGDSLLDLQADLDAVGQVQPSAVKSYTWDYSKQALVSTGAQGGTVKEGGDTPSSRLAKVLPIKLQSQNSTANLGEDELAAWGGATVLRSQLGRLRGQVRFVGSALARVGKTLALANLGKHFDGSVWVSAVHHALGDNQWQTTASFGLSPHSPVSEAENIVAPSAAGLLPAVRGLQPAVVKAVAVDPKGEFRVQVRLCGLPEAKEDESLLWARLGTFYASKGCGAVFYPEKDDEVVLGFMNEDPREPVILGALYSKNREALPAPDAKNNKKSITTRSKLELSFDEQDKIIELKTPGGHSVKLDDKGQSITLLDSHKNRVVMSSDGIALESKSDIQISAEGSIKIEAKGGDVKLQAGNKLSGQATELALNGSAKASLKAPMAQIEASGVLTLRGGIVNIN
jgi:Rhs element Vgr protein